MDNEAKLSEEQINLIKNEMKSSDITRKIDADEFIRKHLDENQAKKVRGILNDPEKLKALLSSPAAQKILTSMKRQEKKEE